MIRHANLAPTGNHIANLVGMAEDISLRLLRDIEATVTSLSGTQKILTGLGDLIASKPEEISRLEPTEGDYIDPEDNLIATLSRTSSMLEDFRKKLGVKRSAIDQDDRLKAHHCEALHDAYKGVMSAADGLAEIVEDFRRAIISHDLKAEPRGDLEVFKTADSLIANLRGQ